MNLKKFSAATGLAAVVAFVVWAFRALRGIPSAAADSINEAESGRDASR